MIGTLGFSGDDTEVHCVTVEEEPFGKKTQGRQRLVRSGIERCADGRPGRLRRVDRPARCARLHAVCCVVIGRDETM